MAAPEYGPFVECPVTGDEEGTRRPKGSSEGFHCFACGATDHPVSA